MSFTPAPPQTPGPGGDTGIVNAPASATTAQQNALSQIEQTLSQYGFSGTELTQLSSWAWQEIVSGNSATQITLDLQQTPQFIARFPAIEARLKAGLPPVSVSQYLSLEDSYEQLERAAGIPPNFASYDALIASDVSPSEYSDRITKGYQAVALADPTVISAFQSYYGITQGQLAAYFLNPTRALPLLEQQALSAQIGGAAAMANFQNPGVTPAPMVPPTPTAVQQTQTQQQGGTLIVGGKLGGGPQPTQNVAPGNIVPLNPVTGQPGDVTATTPQAITQAQALRLAQLGVTQVQAQQGFQALAREQQLYTPLPGQAQIGGTLSTDQLLNAQFGSDGQTQLELQMRAQFEKGTTEQGTQVGTTSGGATGVSNVQR